jgi:hypothetical protein
VNAEGAGDLADGFPLLEEPLGEAPLVHIHLFRSSEANAALLCVGAASAGAFADQVAFEFGDSGEYGHDHLAGMGGGIGPRSGDGLQASTGIADRFDDIEETSGGACQPVELPDGDDIAIAKLVEHPVQLGPVAICSGDFLAEDACSTGRLESFKLKSQPLIFGGDAGIAYFHWTASTAFAKYFAIGLVFARYFRNSALANF